ncbi:MAG TPA: sarcosine oxidase subunit alpha family protein, partial [Hyphomicrobiaceae bacterium]|nr:sarcosine oxidase subunit alpha family protein [Hyphomicrobiaceae bacterium]
ARRLSFAFDGVRYDGSAGDTLASGLLANGVHLVGRSFKYHRPRGILSAGSEEPNALVTVVRDDGSGRDTPNLRATQVVLYDGLEARSQNRWPSLSFDAGVLNDGLSSIFSAGFYYKTFMGPNIGPKWARRWGGKWGPNWAWAKVYEPAIRRMAGLGEAPKAADPDHYANRFAHCDVLVVGAGPAGLAAATAAAQRGERVILCDEQDELGGALLAETSATIEGMAAQDWLARTLAELRSNERVTMLPRTQAFGYFAQNFVALAERLTDHLADIDPEWPRERLWQVRAGQVVLATGAIERPLVFPGNDRPGVMLADAARVYLNRYGVKAGSRAVVVTACDTAYTAALDLKAAGVDIAAIADVRAQPGAVVEGAARAAGIRVERSTVVTGTGGRLRVNSANLGHVEPDGSVRSGERLACDLVLMSGGWTPSVHLFSQARGKLVWDEALGAYLPGETPQAQRSAGACRGVFGLARALEDGAQSSVPPVADELLPDAEDFAGFIGALPGLDKAARAFVDFQHDVTTKDLKLAVQEGFRSIEHVKRYTTAGMATDQGKTSNINALAIVAKATGKSIPEVGLTTFRQPYTPVSFGTLAGHNRGDLFDPIRRTPMHGWACAQGAVFENVGLWKRAQYFARPGEDIHAAVSRECRTVRSTVGLLDASTLGKIEVAGPDAAEFLERLYVNPFKKLGVGRCRYGVLLNEAGFIIDDGVIGRIADDVFHVTTTTGGAPRVLHMMEDYLQTEFPELKVWLTSTTEQWAVIAVQGPRARDVLAPLIDGVDISDSAFAHMSVAEGYVRGIKMRLFRVSFTGEAGFEVNVAAGFGQPVWDAIWAEAQKYDGCVYGTEAMHVLRAEKGFIIVGQE